jgi:hypothetical protein
LHGLAYIHNREFLSRIQLVIGLPVADLFLLSSPQRFVYASVISIFIQALGARQIAGEWDGAGKG